MTDPQIRPEEATAVREVLESSRNRMSHFVSTDPRSEAIFKEAFQNREGWTRFFESHLSGLPSEQLLQPDAKWSPQSFQALFCAAWAHHPTEKGGYMINLSGFNKAQLEAVRAAFDKHCRSRPSSHLDKAGGSAGKDYRFLEGYEELLIHMPVIGDQPYLYLKTEGHKLDAKGFLAHMASWAVKAVTGHGMTASEPLHELAKQEPELVEPRAAENYSKTYGKLLDKLELKGKQVTVHQMAEKLLAGHDAAGGGTPISQLTNNELGRILEQALENPERPPLLQDPGYADEVRQLAHRLLLDNPGQIGRVFHEVIVTPWQLDDVVNSFNTPQA